MVSLVVKFFWFCYIFGILRTSLQSKLKFFFTTLISLSCLNSFLFAKDINSPSFNELTRKYYKRLCQDTYPQITLVMSRCLNYSILFSLDYLKGVFTEKELTEIHEFLKKYCKKSVNYSYGDLKQPLGILYSLKVGLCIANTLEDFIQYSKYGKLLSHSEKR